MRTRNNMRLKQINERKKTYLTEGYRNWNGENYPGDYFATRWSSERAFVCIKDIGV